MKYLSRKSILLAIFTAMILLLAVAGFARVTDIVSDQINQSADSYSTVSVNL